VLPYVFVVPAVASFPAISDVSSVDVSEVDYTPAVVDFSAETSLPAIACADLLAVHAIPDVVAWLFQCCRLTLLRMGLASLCTSAVILLLLAFFLHSWCLCFYVPTLLICCWLSLSVTTAVDSVCAVSDISAVNGFSTFLLFSSIAGFPSVAGLPAAAIAAMLFLAFLHS
jgi:hypothetical protein